MKPKPLCLVCTLRTAHDVARRSTDDENLQMKMKHTKGFAGIAIKKMKT